MSGPKAAASDEFHERARRLTGEGKKILDQFLPNNSIRIYEGGQLAILLRPALDKLDLAIGLWPNYGKSHFERGRALMFIDREKGLSDFRVAWTHLEDLDNEQIELLLAFFHGNTLRLMAQNGLERIALCRPEDKQAWVTICFYSSQSRFQAADYQSYMDELESLTSSDNFKSATSIQRSRIWKCLGQAYEILNKDDAAESSYRRLISEKVSDPIVALGTEAIVRTRMHRSLSEARKVLGELQGSMKPEQVILLSAVIDILGGKDVKEYPTAGPDKLTTNTELESLSGEASHLSTEDYAAIMEAAKDLIEDHSIVSSLSDQTYGDFYEGLFLWNSGDLVKAKSKLEKVVKRKVLMPWEGAQAERVLNSINAP